MLVLTRKLGEKIRIGTNVTLVVLKTGTTSAKIGVEAPSEIRIERGELPGAADRPALEVRSIEIWFVGEMPFLSQAEAEAAAGALAYLERRPVTVSVATASHLVHRTVKQVAARSRRALRRIARHKSA